MTEHSWLTGNPATAVCPQCRTTIYGSASDIDSGLRKHMEYCEPADDTASESEEY